MSDPAASASWRNDPLADFLVFQLVRLAGVTLGQHFEGPAPEKSYKTWLRRETRRKSGGTPTVLETWDDHPEYATLSLTAQPTANTFFLTLSHPDFTAEILATYDVEITEVQRASVRHFHGDIARAIEGAGNWFNEFIEIDNDDLDITEDGWDEMLRNARASDDDNEDEASNGPPDDTPADRRRLQRMASTVSRRVHDDIPPQLSDADETWLAMTPQTLRPMLEGAVAAALKKPRDKLLLTAWVTMLAYQLEQVRYQSERGHDWAVAMLADYQRRLLDLANGEKLAHEDLFSLAAILGHAKVPVDPMLSEAVMGAGSADVPSMPLDQALQQGVRPLIDELARNVSSPFELMEALGESAAVTPAVLRSFIAHELALSPHAVMRDSVPLMLLDREPEVRLAAAQALDQMAATMPPQALRRAITLRNWIPEADRPPLDQAIRKARAKGVQPAQWDPPRDIAHRASPCDGSGAQSLLFASRTGKTGLFGGLLLKQGFGIRDAWCSRDMPRREIGSAVAAAQHELVIPEVEQSYTDLAVQHCIAVGVAAGHMPDPALLDIAEAVGGSDWKGRSVDVPAETEQLLAAFPAEQRTPAAVAASSRRMRGWMDTNPLSDSWFEDDAEVRSVLESTTRDDIADAAGKLLDGPLEQRRAVWAERFLMTALCARAVKPGQSPLLGNAGRGVTWRDLVVLAHTVLSETNLRDIAVMVHIAERTVAAGRAMKW
jgi:hypothetical protein